MMANPFETRYPVIYPQFVNRSNELDQLCESVLEIGQSIALIGEPRTGKSSLLNLLSTPEYSEQLFGQDARRLIFSQLDVRLYGSGLTFGDFWKHVLSPCLGRMSLYNNNHFETFYQKFLTSNYASGNLEQLIDQVRSSGQKLVVLIDDFDSIFNFPIPDRRSLFGSMRSLSSRSKGALVFVIAINCDIVTLEELAQSDDRVGGSQYFNTYKPIRLSMFDRSAVEQVAALGMISREDIDFVEHMAGGHPYLVQLTSSILWKSHQGKQLPPRQQMEAVATSLLEQASPTLHFIWNRWTPEMRLAFTLVALTEVPNLANLKFSMSTLSQKFGELSGEITSLERMGYIYEDVSASFGKRINGKVMLWFLLDRIKDGVNKQNELGEWIRLNGWNGLLAVHQVEELYGIAVASTKWFGEALLKGSGTLLLDILKKSMGIP